MISLKTCLLSLSANTTVRHQNTKVLITESVIRNNITLKVIHHSRTSTFGAAIPGNNSGTRLLEGPSRDSPFFLELLNLRMELQVFTQKLSTPNWRDLLAKLATWIEEVREMMSPEQLLPTQLCDTKPHSYTLNLIYCATPGLFL
ncbi:hypothetical protein TNCV_2118621 [Trichonephila clavipes]|nr:hypothetical protein TNCV_2118621 [Trichonephila clavipes]